MKVDFTRNNLDKANSPYLRQHKDNPIHWQEWSKEVLDYALKEKKLIFVSVGYATCHWCHVMAKEAFSDTEVADFLNEKFVSIKVDREQRPDIDQHFMNFLVSTQGNGGWPMNLVLTPDQKPFFAGTYFPVESTSFHSGFKQVLEQVLDWYRENSEHIQPFVPGRRMEENSQINDERTLVETINSQFDEEFGGWGQGAKFPPHNTLIFLINYLTKEPSQKTLDMITKTLDQMTKGGLHDHLQGGFFRYCVDRRWRIPHFEKMLYDQAMLLWVYSLGFQLFKKELYKIAAQKIIEGLDKVFFNKDLYCSAIDADTNHQEGAIYLWNEGEIKNALTEDEWEEFTKVYDLSEKSKVDGKYHLIKKTEKILPEIEYKLLQVRNKKPQPEKDQKIITSWNALLGIAFLMAGRYLKSESFNQKGIVLYQKLLAKHWDGKKLAHSSLDDKLQGQAFLEDYAAILLLATYIHEETSEEKPLILILKQRVLEYFKDGRWMEGVVSADFNPVEASGFDHPTPSSVSLAEEALRRSTIILGEVDERKMQYKMPLESDFYNLVVFYKLGNFHEIHAKEKTDYTLLPINSMQFKDGEYQDCYRMQCQRYKDGQALLDAFKARI